MDFVTDITDNFLEVISETFQGIGSGLVDLFKTIMLTEDGGLNEMGVWIVVFMGLSFAVTITWRLLRKVL
jgi:hypothetical protein